MHPVLPPTSPGRFFRVGIIVLTSLALAIGTGFAARAAWKHRNLALVAQFASRARDARQNRDWTGAHGALLAAHALAPAHPNVLRGLAEFYSTFNNPEAVAYWRLLENTGALNAADRLAFTRLALNIHRPDLARRSLAPFHQSNPGDPAGLILVSEIFSKEGDLPQARAAAEAAAAAGAETQTVELRLAMLDLGSPRPEDWTRAKVRLLAMVMTASRLRAEAATALLARNLVTRAEEGLLATLLPDDAKASFRERTVRLVLALRRKAAPVTSLLKPFITANQLSTASSELIAAGEILAQTGQHSAVLELIPEPLALANQSLCRLRLGALAATGDIAGTDRLLAAPGNPLAPKQVAIFRAGAAQAAGRTNEFKSLWEIALANCRGDADALELLARNAESVGATAAAVKSWEFLLLDPMFAARAANELMRLGTVHRDPRTLHVALRRTAELHPEDSGARLALAYCQLLLQVDEEKTRKTVAAGPGAYPNRDLYQIVAALAALRETDAEKAVKALEDPAINWSDAPVSWRMVRAAALGRAGLSSEARKMAATLVPDALSAPELALVAPWLPAAKPFDPGE